MLNACTKLRYFTRGKQIINQILTENNPFFVQNTTLVTTMIDMLVSLIFYMYSSSICIIIKRVKLEMILNYVFDYLILLKLNNVHRFYTV